jgi:hypothetical protein
VKHLLIAICFGLGLCITTNSYAEYSPYGNKSLFFRVNALSYSDINSSSNSGSSSTTTTPSYKDAYEFKMGMQVRNMYYLTGTALTSDNHSSYGGGIKIRLPGFFLIGGSVLDLFTKKETSRLQTFVSYSLLDTTLKTTTAGATTTQKFVENVFALNIHVRIFNDVFLCGEGSIRAFLGDHVYAYGGGLGFGF